MRLFQRPLTALAIANGFLFFLAVAHGQSPEARAKQGQQASNSSLEAWLKVLERSVGKDAAGFNQKSDAQIATAADAVEKWVHQICRFEEGEPTETSFTRLRDALTAKDRVDGLLDRVLAIGGKLAADGGEDRDRMRAYLLATTRLSDLSGRIRYTLSDALRIATARAAGLPDLREQILDELLARRSAVGAIVMAEELVDHSSETSQGFQAFGARGCQKTLNLIVASGQTTLLPTIVKFMEARGDAPTWTIACAEAIRKLGLPQEPRPNSPADLPKPSITPKVLQARLLAIEAGKLDEGFSRRHSALLAWLEPICAQGVVGESYKVGKLELQAGDWLLMRNPSPFNLFTDLSPGLFTHVGVVALETGSDGLKRMVVVDLPERGDRIPATNVEIYLERTLNYVFLRHPSRDVAQGMGEVAREAIGVPSRFDFNFRVDRLAELQGKPLAESTIHTYCAGFLLLCADRAGASRGELFPVSERSPPGHQAENIAQLGLSIGENFISPTGAVFSSQLTIVGRREPMYDPKREVEEAVFDYFASAMREKRLQPSNNLFQSLRLKLAEAAKHNDLLAKAMASAAGVNADTDLVAAAKAVAVIETLDEIAQGQSAEFEAARKALRSEPADGASDDDASKNREYQSQHGDWYRRFRQREITSRQLRKLLVDYYIDRGKAAIDARFFGKS